jgi:diadenosine tetraphosphate (Ap4A) HIT family hydrolase
MFPPGASGYNGRAGHSRSIESLHELTTREAEALGRLLRDSSVALKTVTACRKTYVMLFAEAEGFAHLHLHVVPRGHALPDDRKGPSVFAYTDDEALTEHDRDDLALRLRAAWPRP